MITKAKALRELTSEELTTRRRDLKHEMINLRVQQQSGQLENPARIFLVRREVARIETILSSRRQPAAPGGGGAPAAAPEAAPAAGKAPAKKKAVARKTKKARAEESAE